MYCNIHFDSFQEIVYWEIDEHNRLNVAMDVLVKDSYEMVNVYFTY